MPAPCGNSRGTRPKVWEVGVGKGEAPRWSEIGPARRVTVHPVGRMDSFAVAVWVERGMRWVWLVSISCSFVFALCVVLLNLAAASLPPRRMGTLVVLMFHGVGRLVCTLSTPRARSMLSSSSESKIRRDRLRVREWILMYLYPSLSWNLLAAVSFVDAWLTCCIVSLPSQSSSRAVWVGVSLASLTLLFSRI